ncbi:hypothetical protein [Lewinella sp. W8]|uniref:hypothetical protein n=1 Tax=Lewinella sp. W8 TaxID=2528208 RepID=UPI0010681AB6|nr:hypothetical protein [Lewinella sp. W8]MTB50812.1 hypothetical protein [Lewinella sp. W8]
MPLFNDLKKIFFGAKSVAKHQASKAGEAAREATDDLKAQSDELIDATKQAARELVDKAPEYVEKGKDALEDLTDKIWKEADAAADKGRELKDKASDAINQKLEDLSPRSSTDDALDLIDEDLSLGSLDEVSAHDAPKSGTIDFEADLVEDTDASPKGSRIKMPKIPDGVKDTANNALDAAAKAGAAAKEQADKLAGKIGEVSEQVGGKILEKGDEVLNRAAEAGADLKGKFDDFVDHANEEAEKMKMEDAIEDAKRAAEQAEARARAFDGKEAARDTSESTLSGTDSFFDRASRFAEGDYHNEGGKEMTIKEDKDAPKKPEGGIIAGFLDSDGDGDSLIDDAIIEEE